MAALGLAAPRMRQGAVAEGLLPEACWRANGRRRLESFRFYPVPSNQKSKSYSPWNRDEGGLKDRHFSFIHHRSLKAPASIWFLGILNTGQR